MKTLVWHGCYEKSLSGFIVPEAFSHPAKFSLALIERVYDHMISRGWIQRGDVVGDPFGGVGVGGLVAAYRKLNWVGVELEPRFVTLGELNIAMHRDRLNALGAPQPCLFRGDSRQFAHHVQSVVTSPPYAQSLRGLNHNGIDPANLDPAKHHTGQSSMLHQKQSYGNSPGQIEKLREGDLASVVSSPPYSNSLSCGGGNNIDYSKARNGGKRVTPCREASGEGYGKTEGQIDRLPNTHIDACISSPPYAAIAAGAGGLNTKPAKKPGQQGGRSAVSASQTADQKYGHSEGQISQLSAIATSPPWESNCEGSRRKGKFKDPAAVLKSNRGHGASDAAVLAQAERDNQKTYGDTAGNIGNLNGGASGVSLVLCQPAMTAEPQSLSNQSGASDATENTSAGRDEKKARPTKGKSDSHTLTSRTHCTSVQTTEGGEAETRRGAASPGESSDGPHSKGINERVANVDLNPKSQSTTKRNRPKQTAFGTTISPTSKHSAEVATQKSTQDETLSLCTSASAATVNESLIPQNQSPGSAIIRHVGDVTTPRNIIGGLFENAASEPAPSVSDCSGLSKEDINTVPTNARVQQEPSKCEATSPDTKQTYWTEMLKIYTQCYLALKPGGYMAIVVKAYVKNRKIVDLPGDTTRLLEHCGFEMVERAHAMLSEKTEHNDLFVGVTVTKRERKSFFRRLYEKDPKNPRIDWETVLFARKPL